MSSSSTDAWASTRKSFADQFEQDGSGFIYRRAQKGEAIRVSAEERTRFIDEFDRNLRRGMWVMYAGMALALGGVVLFPVLRGSDLRQAAIFVAMAIVIIPYLFYIYWAWGAPARELAGRTPIAGARSPDEVRRLRFQRITYGKLGFSALAALALPFMVSGRQDLFSGWNRLWLAFSGALLFFVAVQAFRKWRFEQEESLSNAIRPLSSPALTDVTQESARSRSKAQLWRYVPLAAMLLGGAFIAFTSVGTQFARAPSFFPTLMVGVGAWALFTVWRGTTTGKIQPFIRGSYGTYDRQTQPKRFWASMVWNGILGCICIGLAFEMPRWTAEQGVRNSCYSKAASSPREAIAACDQLIDGNAPLGGWTRADIFLDRGIAYDNSGDPRRAIADYSAAIRLQPKYPEAYYDRALAYEKVGNVARALSDYGSDIQLRPRDPEPYLNRGLIYLELRRFDQAISDFSRSHDLNPKDPWPLANRGLAYAWEDDAGGAAQDFAAVRAIDPSNYVMNHGEAVLSLKAGDTRSEIDHLSAALAANPKDSWSLQMRAKAYRELGEGEKADADLMQLKVLSSGSKS